MYQLRKTLLKKHNNNKLKAEKTKTRENSIKMAKSLRSKWKRKMKAEKRVKYGEREDKRLIKMLEAAEELKKQDGQDAVMMTNEPKDDDKETVITEDSMDTTAKPKYSSKTMKDEHGNYPAWMSMRRIQKAKKSAKKSKGKVTKRKK